MPFYGPMVELLYALVLGPSVERHVGGNPSRATNLPIREACYLGFVTRAVRSIPGCRLHLMAGRISIPKGLISLSYCVRLAAPQPKRR